MPTYRPPAPLPEQVRRAYEQASSDVPDPEEEAYAAGVAWGGANPPSKEANPAPRPPAAEGEDDDDFDRSDEEEEGEEVEGRGGPDLQAAMHASFQSLRTERAKRA